MHIDVMGVTTIAANLATVAGFLLLILRPRPRVRRIRIRRGD